MDTLLCRGKAPGPTTDQKVTVSCRSAGLKVLQQYSDVIAHELGTVESMTVRLALGQNFIFPVLCRLQSREPLKRNLIDHLDQAGIWKRWRPVYGLHHCAKKDGMWQLWR